MSASESSILCIHRYTTQRPAVGNKCHVCGGKASAEDVRVFSAPKSSKSHIKAEAFDLDAFRVLMGE